MGKPVIYNFDFDNGIAYTFDLTIKEDGGGAKDISGFSFLYTLTRKRDNTVVWTVTQFTNPSTGRIQFVKSALEVAALQEGEYVHSLKVTGDIYLDDEWLTGTATRK